MKELFKGKPLKVVEKLKKEIIKETKDIKLNDSYFECNGVEEIQRDINTYLDIINGIYQDLLIEYINEDSIIGVYQNQMEKSVTIKKEMNNMLKKYEEVFENEIKDYIADKEADRGMKLNISEEGIKKIAHYLIYDNEYIWETIHEIIDYQLKDYNFMSDDEEEVI